jgi:xylulokinase
VNHSSEAVRLGVLLCINGTGSANRWLRQTLGKTGYDDLNRLAATAPIGADGLLFYPFGNGAERMLGEPRSRASSAACGSIVTARRTSPAPSRRIAFSFRYGIGILEEVGLHPSVMRSGLGSMLLSPLFREALTGVTGCTLELYRTDGATGAARGAALGAGFYRSPSETFRGLGARGYHRARPRARAATARHTKSGPRVFSGLFLTAQRVLRIFSGA